ncbi:predicted ATP-dependent protease [Plesiocystis pacifica SIR-1]|uniref:Lon protease n=1 Tax=Plesiocystis pacifica SIR-1 TaxID=391625 RepID=A6GAZ5_9BACT|nr:S16 family serine protease [Plesiocystis pacifica]EDM76980.1 predicted ATP-dependent protease [Plesiocystis pacifica SIR-1]
MSDGSPETGVLPLLPLRSAVLFPGVSMPVDLGRPSSVEAVRQATAHGKRFGPHNHVIVAVQRDPMNDHPRLADLHPVATLTRVVQVLRGLPGRMTVIVRGIERVRLESLDLAPEASCDLARYVSLPPTQGELTMVIALSGVLRDLTRRHESLLPASRATQQRQETLKELAAERDPARIGDLVANLVELETEQRIELLQQLDPTERLRKLIEHVAARCNELEVKRDIDRSVREHLSRHEHEAVLRHKLRAIQAELGDEGGDTWLEELAERLDQKLLPEEAQIAVDRELGRLERMNPQSSEAMIARTYLEWIADLPWVFPGRPTERPEVDLEAARVRLDADHHGLEKVKKRVLEYLAVRKLAPNQRGPLLCFAGPPGVGKTTLAKSIAATLGREFVRISLGGVRDDAEIRGHRRTYVGALPGRLVQAMKTAGTTDPVILLDEIDKLSGADLRGDPASALLETLDPEQNDAFEDHYLGVPYDLSQVVFICTANELGAIPMVLRDRLEIINLSGYTLAEKLAIAREHLLPKELHENGLGGVASIEPGSLREQRARNESLLARSRLAAESGTAFELAEVLEKAEAEGLERLDSVLVDDAVFERLATEYTRESGVRSLQRQLAALLRDVAMQRAETPASELVTPQRITVEDLLRVLGPPRYREELMGRGPRVGVATGLGWTATGGRLLFVEVTTTAGKGKLRMTGRLGEVMKESAQAALSLVKSDARRFGLDIDDLDRRDIHIHLPSGAVPKDGPSAGITLVTALVSTLGGYAVRHDLAMTGEVTLRGHVLAVGGIREKVLAAHRAGIRDVILPARNRKDEPEIPEAARADLRLHFVGHIDEVLELTLRAPESARSTTASADAAAHSP